MTLDFLIQVIGVLAPPVAIYVGIRVDQAVMKVKVDRAYDSATRCHERIDDHLTNHIFK